LRMNDRAHRDCPVEPHWLGEGHVRRASQEYGVADTIVVPSEYARQSFLREGVAPNRIRRRILQVHERFRCPRTVSDDGVFRVVYVGALSIAKGVHLLLDAFSRLQGQAELTLVGGWGTRGMRRFVAERLRRDQRVRVIVGDPLPYLLRAHVFVHPSYQDGLGLAPLEAMACGLPVIVSEDTGMKEYVTEGINGYVVPTGDAEAILERLQAMYRSR
jgi:glycosyltransferase involved in cell wall biosynthesis